ncbi:MAG: hypothetical protein EXR99_11065 [Gemmataceae bacterium]|nr:hypothetical protein [Gemmataceae bacterium]
MLPASSRAQEGEKKGEKGFRAGAAASNITPRLGRKIVGNFTQPPATHVHDELQVRCLVLDDGATRLAFAICDSVGIDRSVFDAAKRLVQSETGIPIDNQLMAATHTHSGVSWNGKDDGDPEYAGFLSRRIADGIRRAINNLEPAELAIGRAEEAGQVFNRRWFLTPETKLLSPFGEIDKVKMNPGVGNQALLKPAGPTDPEISFLAFRALDGRHLALLANYSLHYVGGVPTGEISADYFAVFANLMEEKLNAKDKARPFVGIMTNGTSGDVNNINFRQAGPRVKPYEKMNQVATLVADRVYSALQKASFKSNIKLGAQWKEIILQARQPDAERVQWAKRTLAKPDDAPKDHPLERFYAQRALNLHDGPSQAAIALQAFRIGEVGITAIPFEVFAEIGLELKKQSPIQPCFNISLANGSGGYLPTPSQHELGGYETWMGTNKVEKEASVKITNTLLDLLNRLNSK